MSGARHKLHGMLKTMAERDDKGASPRKMVVKVGRKRKRREEEPDLSQLQHTYVMKLFDRSVDLAQFDEDAPLYPICRAWMKNQPLHRVIKEEPVVESDSSDDEWDENAFMEDETPRDIRRLPPPMPLDPARPRAAPPVKSDDPPLDLNQDDEGILPQPEELLLGHMQRWKETRIRWRDHSRDNEGRYAHSLNLLRAMYERQMKDA